MEVRVWALDGCGSGHRGRVSRHQGRQEIELAGVLEGGADRDDVGAGGKIIGRIVRIDATRGDDADIREGPAHTFYPCRTEARGREGLHPLHPVLGGSLDLGRRGYTGEMGQS